MPAAKRKASDLAALSCQVWDWNKAHSVGTKVSVVRDNGTALATITRSEAWVMSEHTAVIMVEGISGAYLLDRVHPVVTPEESKK